jgi:hypothetical protein
MNIPNPRIRNVSTILISLLGLALPSALSPQSVQLDSSAVAPASAQEPLSPAALQPHRSPAAAGILGGTLGSGVGFIGGALAGYAMATCGRSEWFCGLGEAAMGALVGSVVGSTVGANIAARHGGASPTFRSTVLGGLAGVLTGLAGGYVLAQMNPDGPAPLIGFSIGQGLVTGLVAARH